MSDVRLWTFAHYRIHDILDVDLVSTTYRATTVDGDQPRRVRVFTSEIQDGQLADVHATVLAEAERARQISHRNVLATLEAGRHNDRIYVVSADLGDAVLREFIARRHPLKPRTVLDIGWQLAEALDEVHAAGVVHGSINPHTVWITDASSTGRQAFTAYLTGFGAAPLLVQQGKAQRRAAVVDDLLYVGPDQIRHEHASVEADRYALACATYHLMTGRPPFNRESLNRLVGAHLFSPVEPPSALRRDLPPALDSAFLRALAKNADERYPSAHALMVGIERALLGRTDSATVRTPKPQTDDAPDGSPWLPAEPATPFLADAETTRRSGAAISARSVEPAPPAPPAAPAPAGSEPPASVPEAAASVPEPAPEPAPESRASTSETPASAPETPASAAAPAEDDQRAPAEEQPPTVTTGETVTVTARPGSAAARRPPKRRILARPRGMVLAMLAAVVAGALTTVVLATQLRDDPPERAAQPRPEPPPPNLIVRGRAEPTVVRPAWTTPVTRTAITEVARVEDAVVVSAGTTIGALNPADGARLWEADLPAAVRDVAVDENVLVAGTASQLTGYEVTSGDVLWNVSGDAAGVDALALGRGEVFTARRAETGVDIARVEPDTGEVTPVGTIDTGGPVPAGDDQLALTFDRSTKEGGLKLYLLTAEALYAFDPEVSDVVWRAPVDPERQIAEPAPRLQAEPWVESLGAIAGAVFVVGKDGEVCRYDGSSGEEVWTFCPPFSGQLDRAPVLYARRARVIVASTDAVTAYDFTNGLTGWGVTLADTLQPAVAGSSQSVYIARQDGTLRSLDHESGLEQWRAEDFVDVTAMLADEGGVFVGRADGSVSHLTSRAVAGAPRR